MNMVRSHGGGGLPCVVKVTNPKLASSEAVTPQPCQTGNVLVAAEVGVSNKKAKKWLTLVVHIVVLAAHLGFLTAFRC